jgi:hypothetical protein
MIDCASRPRPDRRSGAATHRRSGNFSTNFRGAPCRLRARRSFTSPVEGRSLLDHQDTAYFSGSGGNEGCSARPRASGFGFAVRIRGSDSGFGPDSAIDSLQDARHRCRTGSTCGSSAEGIRPPSRAPSRLMTCSRQAQRSLPGRLRSYHGGPGARGSQPIGARTAWPQTHSAPLVATSPHPTCATAFAGPFLDQTIKSLLPVRPGSRL